MSVGQCHEGLGHLDDAAAHIRSAVQIFEKTCGHSSPLTANALGVLGRIFIAQGKSEEAEPLVLESLNLEAAKDAFHPDTVWRLLNTLKEIWTDGGRQMKLEELNAKCKRYEPAIQCCTTRIDELKLEENAKEVGTVSVIFKTAGERALHARRDVPAGATVPSARPRASETNQRLRLHRAHPVLRFLAGIPLKYRLGLLRTGTDVWPSIAPATGRQRTEDRRARWHCRAHSLLSASGRVPRLSSLGSLCSGTTKSGRR